LISRHHPAHPGAQHALRRKPVKSRRAHRLRYHLLHWLDAATWPASLIIKAAALAIKGVRRLFARATAS
jgi:hypothetical protein